MLKNIIIFEERLIQVPIFFTQSDEQYSTLKYTLKCMGFNLSSQLYQDFLIPIIEKKKSIVKVLNEIVKKKIPCEVLIPIRDLLIIGTSRVLRI
ncbi:MAG: hypothetical protein ACRDA0_01790 [Cetobacterium sp.]|uniref:hypothetical protein n=1 Tax=Cetobacterium sp. TaxID=2071632 RepID=UPI003F2D715E